MKTSFTLMLTGLLFMLPAAVMAGGQSESPQTEQHTESVGGAGTVEELKEFAGAGTSIESTVNEDGVLELTVDRAVEIAMDNNLQLKSSAIDTRIKERKADYAWNRFVPSVQASGTLGRMNEAQQQMEFDPLAPTGIVMTEAPQWSVSAGLDLSLTLNMAMFNGIRATQLDYQAGRISLEQARQRVARDVKKSFYNLLLMQENRQLMVENIDAAERRYEQARINYENGLVPELTMLNAEVAYENLKPQLKSIDLGYRQAIQGFKMTLGISLDRELALEGTIDAEPVSVDSEQLISEHLTDRLDIQSVVNGITSLRNQIEATKLQAFTPSLILGYNMDPSFAGDPWKDPWFDDISNDWNQRSGMFRVTIAMSLESLLPFSQTQVGLRELEDNLEKTKIGLMQSIDGAELEIDSTVRQLEKSRDTIETLQLNVERARRAYEMAEEAYNAGSQELLEVQNAEIELKQARLEVLKEKYTYLSALIDLEYQLNTNIERIIEE
ncbi:MAG: TolC family protein [Spirochaetia bacterium]|nr:TolC family protein [Spirochaetia bacterium]